MDNKPLTIGEIGERETIARIVAVAPSSRNGDDAAVLGQPAPNSRTVVTTDMLVEGRHFRREWSTPEEIGQRAILQNFADIEAMGARPVAAVLGLSAPEDTPIATIEGIARGVETQVAHYNSELVGGDVTGGDCLTLSVTAIGSLGGSAAPLTLDRARPGQQVVAAGSIGYSGAGLALLQAFGRADVPPELEPLVKAFVSPILQPGRGVIARATGATCMTDNSDGLIVDLGTIAGRSRVTIDLDREAIAPDSLLLKAGELLDTDPWLWVLSGGEDHTLLATTAHAVPSGFRPIGRVIKAGSNGVLIDAQPPQSTSGWVSF
ncbi:thiamine-phosphate kinase [Corynebacterium sp. H128]|uniref:thiamine-phosphate kinase n=1 Tax=unclassified Corynebacterium TaxID=2624378 RepID=UPI0030AC1508